MNGITENEFMLAVQETNFLFSFTLSALSSMGTALTILRENSYTLIDQIMVSIAMVYGVFGTIIAILVYGRKVQKDFTQSSVEHNQM